MIYAYVDTQHQDFRIDGPLSFVRRNGVLFAQARGLIRSTTGHYPALPPIAPDPNAPAIASTAPPFGTWKLIEIGELRHAFGEYWEAECLFGGVPDPEDEIVSPYMYIYPGAIWHFLMWQCLPVQIPPGGQPPGQGCEGQTTTAWQLVVVPFVVREPKQMVVAARRHIEYMLQPDPPTPIEPFRVTITSLTGVMTPWGVFVVQDSDIFGSARYSDYIHFGIWNTDPTKDEYVQMVQNQDEIVAEMSTVSRVAGNLWRRETLYVKAM